jgi:hypothetical protein
MQQIASQAWVQTAFGGVIGVAMALSIDGAVLAQFATWTYGWLIEPFTRLSLITGLCG